MIPPWPHYRTLFISRFLANADEGLLYSQMPPDASIAGWMTALLGQVRTVIPEFGAKLAALLTADNAAPGEFGAVLGADLNAIATQPLLLFIDEFDPLVWADDMPSFLETLVDALGNSVKIVLSTRMQSYHPFTKVVANGIAVILGIEWERNNLHFVVETQPKPQLEIYGFGKPRTLVNGHEIVQWEGMLPKLLFYYLADHRLVTRDEVFADFWPKVSTKDATDIFHVTKHKVTEVLSRPLGNRPLDLTQYTQGFYVPSSLFIRHYDVAGFEAAVERAQSVESDAERETYAQTALSLYKGPFLEGLNTPWIIERREELTRLHGEAYIIMGRVHCAQRNLNESAAAYEEALKVLPMREDVQRELIRCYLQMGDVAKAQKQLAAIEDKAYRKVGVRPTPASLELRELVASATD
ncbi:MAG: tetratricopeptide repeat protein [Anaerolineae bacterium]|nr:tetratricopeptide repeat protein [Anaerolineae bacterium]